MKKKCCCILIWFGFFLNIIIKLLYLLNFKLDFIRIIKILSYDIKELIIEYYLN